MDENGILGTFQKKIMEKSESKDYFSILVIDIFSNKRVLNKKG